MITLYLICFVLGFTLSIFAAFSGMGRLHIGHMRHVPLHGHAKPGSHPSAFNGFTLPAFLCWFGGAGYLLDRYSSLYAPLILFVAAICGLAAASVLYVALFKLLLPRERVLSPDDTRMDGVLARVSDEIRADGGIGEILFSQADARRSAAARSESGLPIARGTEVVVLRYVRGIAYVSPLDDLPYSPTS